MTNKPRFSARSKEPVDAEVKLNCIESVPKLGDLDQFYSDGPYTEQTLNDFEKYKDDLD